MSDLAPLLQRPDAARKDVQTPQEHLLVLEREGEESAIAVARPGRGRHTGCGASRRQSPGPGTAEPDRRGASSTETGCINSADRPGDSPASAAGRSSPVGGSSRRTTPAENPNTSRVFSRTRCRTTSSSGWLPSVLRIEHSAVTDTRADLPTSVATVGSNDLPRGDEDFRGFAFRAVRGKVPGYPPPGSRGRGRSPANEAPGQDQGDNRGRAKSEKDIASGSNYIMVQRVAKYTEVSMTLLPAVLFFFLVATGLAIADERKLRPSWGRSNTSGRRAHRER